MNLATNLFLAYIIYIISSYIKLAFNKNEREEHIKTRKRLEELRKIPLKTAEEQKEFVNLKYPKEDPFVWSFKNVIIFIGKLIPMVATFIGARYIWKHYIVFEFVLWQVLIIMVFLPIIINKIMKKFNLHNDDISVFFK